jgi:hypothetical protein
MGVKTYLGNSYLFGIIEIQKGTRLRPRNKNKMD